MRLAPESARSSPGHRTSSASTIARPGVGFARCASRDLPLLFMMPTAMVDNPQCYVMIGPGLLVVDFRFSARKVFWCSTAATRRNSRSPIGAEKALGPSHKPPQQPRVTSIGRLRGRGVALPGPEHAPKRANAGSAPACPHHDLAEFAQPEHRTRGHRAERPVPRAEARRRERLLENGQIYHARLQHE